MCKTKIQIYLYYDEIRKHKHENSITRLWCKIITQIGVEQIENIKVFYFYLYPFGDLTQRSFHGGFHVCIDYGSFLKGFLTINEL